MPSTPPAVRHLLQEQKGVRTAKEAAALLWEDKEDQDQCCLRCAEQDEDQSATDYRVMARSAST